MLDVAVIGAGVIGCSIARELSKYELTVCVIEKEADVAEGTTKANSAIVHAGFDARPDSLKGKLNAKGNIMFDELSMELDFHFKRIGALVLCFEEKDLYKLEALKEQGEINGVPGLRILSKEEALIMEPSLNDAVFAALYAPSSGIVCPYEMTIALAENANLNGVDFHLETAVKHIEKSGDGYQIKTNKGDFEARIVINAAGVFVDEFNNMVSSKKFNIVPRKGEYCLFDKEAGDLVSKTIFQLPTEMGKGVLVTPTVDGNLLLGPNAVDIEDKDGRTTTREGLTEIVGKGRLSVKTLPINKMITSFSGLRAHSALDDFIIGEAEGAENFINAAGIESPGLSSAPAIAELVSALVTKKLKPFKKDSFKNKREGIIRFRELNNKDRQKLIEKSASYGRVVCRCEVVTEGEIIDAIRRPVGARTLDAVKRRTRAGMGRCQAGFCSSRILEILSRELNIDTSEVTKFGGASKILVGKNKDSYK